MRWMFDRHMELKEGMLVPIQGQGEEVEFGREEPLHLECRAFLQAMASRRPLTNGRSGLRVLNVLQAALPRDQGGAAAGRGLGDPAIQRKCQVAWPILRRNGSVTGSDPRA
jgi:hypothetical protein